MVYGEASAVQRRCDPPVAVSPLVFVVNCRDLLFFRLVLIRLLLLFQMIVEGCTGQLSDREQDLQRMFTPQLLNYQCFLRWRRSSSKTKACKFFR